MNTWNQNVMGQTQYQPNMMMYRLPTYKADPIHGENAAWQFPMGPNSETYLPDADEDIIWWIRTDVNGNKTVQPLDVMPHKKQPPIDLNSIVERLNILEEKVNGKLNKPNAKRTNGASIDASIE